VDVTEELMCFGTHVHACATPSPLYHSLTARKTSGDYNTCFKKISEVLPHQNGARSLTHTLFYFYFSNLHEFEVHKVDCSQDASVPQNN
jgi:hypothetical protein